MIEKDLWEIQICGNLAVVGVGGREALGCPYLWSASWQESSVLSQKARNVHIRQYRLQSQLNFSTLFSIIWQSPYWLISNQMKAHESRVMVLIVQGPWEVPKTFLGG